MDLVRLALDVAISSGVAAGIAMFFRFYVRPKSDKVFDENQRTMLNRLFANTEAFDSEVDACYRVVEENCGQLTPDNEKPFRAGQPRTRSAGGPIMSISYVKHTLKKQNERLEVLYDHLMIHNQRAGIYLSEVLLSNIVAYYMDAINWAQSMSLGMNLAPFLWDRRKRAHEIIAFLEQNSLNSREFGTTIFIQKWKDADLHESS